MTRAVLPLLLAAAALAGVPCEQADDSRLAVQRALDVPGLVGPARIAAQLERLDKLLAERPGDVFLHLSYQQHSRYRQSSRTAMADRYRLLAAQHPDDPLYVFLHGAALVDIDTPRAIGMLRGAPRYPRAHLALSNAYSFGRTADRAAARNELDAFLDACPATLDGQALQALAGATAGTAMKAAGPLRNRLESLTDSALASKWETLWNLEFKARPANEHAEVRRQVSRDTKRLEAATATPTAELLMVLRTGYRLAGDSADERRIEERLLAEFASTPQGQRVERERWAREHPSPRQDEPRDAYRRATIAHADEILKRSPEDFLVRLERFDAMAALHCTTAGEIAAAGEELLAALRKGVDVYGSPPFEFRVARVYADNGVRLEAIPALIEERWKSFHERNDDRPVSDREVPGHDYIGEAHARNQAAHILLDTAINLHQPDLARAAIAAIQKEDPNTWGLRARLAELDGHKLDALLMFREAGAINEVDRLWKELGGTGAAKKLWTRTTVNVAARPSRWTKPDKAMPLWSLTDFEGKTWKLASLEGKAVLINVWATWCGPCREEHPLLQKIYEKVNQRAGVEVLTFNIDDEIGSVAPYMKEHGYTFPVLLAKPLVQDLLPAIVVPQNWIVDRKSAWQWSQVGFSDAPAWETDLLAKLDVK